jgi:hypothetical protein
MKNFVKENWYKLMVGSSMMMASFGFMMYAISPAYSNNNENKVEIPSSQNTTSPVGSNGVIVGDYVYFVDGGYVYRNKKDLGVYCEKIAPSYSSSGWTKFKLP